MSRFLVLIVFLSMTQFGSMANAGTACWIHQNSCPKYPQYSGWFSDNWDNSANNEQRCLQRASDFQAWCQTTISDAFFLDARGALKSARRAVRPAAGVGFLSGLVEARISGSHDLAPLEVTPSIVSYYRDPSNGQEHRQFLFSTDFSSICWTPLSPVQNALSFNDPSACGSRTLYGEMDWRFAPIIDFFDLSRITKSVVRMDLNQNVDNSFNPGAQIYVGKPWRVSYNGAFNTHILNSSPSREATLFSVNHAENKNTRVKIGDRFEYRQNSFNSVLPQGDSTKNPPIPPCYSGTRDKYVFGDEKGDYEECQSAYHAFVTLSYTPFAYDPARGLNWGKNLNVDLGPIVWPAGGYVSSPEKVVRVVRHPSSIVHDGFLYVFYVDESTIDPSEVSKGRGAGIKVARAPIRNNSVEPKEFKNYFSGNALSQDPFKENSLPPSLDRNSSWSVLNAVRMGANAGHGRSSDITGDSTRIFNRFSVAKVRGTPYFAAVSLEAIRDNSGRGLHQWQVNIRTSNNLYEWSAPVTVPGLVTSNSDGTTTPHLFYPVFMDKQGTTNLEFDADGFYIYGVDTVVSESPPGVKKVEQVVKKVKLILGIPP